MTMQNIDTHIRCHPFSNAPYVGCKHCCHEIFKCHTCLHRRDTPDGAAAIFSADKCADEHFANNHIITCLIYTTAIFHSTWSKEKAKTHITECIVKATDMFVPTVWTPCG